MLLAFFFPHTGAGAIQLPLQNLLIGYENVTVMTCMDDPRTSTCSGISLVPASFQYGPITSGISTTRKDDNAYKNPVVVGYDPEPGDIQIIPQNVVTHTVSSGLDTISGTAIYPHIWPEYPYWTDSEGSFRSADYLPNARLTLGYYDDDNDGAHTNYFVTALPNGTTTGVLRQHAMRLNSSTTCEKIAAKDFPSACPGKRPFTASFSRPDVIDIKVCVPGEYGVSPWTLSRNRQDIGEELFLNVSMPDKSFYITQYHTNYTLHCKSGTTRGYFELGNIRNKNAYGPLIDKWPSKQEMEEDYNDITGGRYNYAPPGEQ